MRKIYNHKKPLIHSRWHHKFISVSSQSWVTCLFVARKNNGPTTTTPLRLGDALHGNRALLHAARRLHATPRGAGGHHCAPPSIACFSSRSRSIRGFITISSQNSKYTECSDLHDLRHGAPAGNVVTVDGDHVANARLVSDFHFIFESLSGMFVFILQDGHGDAMTCGARRMCRTRSIC